MNILKPNDKRIINDFLSLSIPKHIYEYNDDTFDLLDCYEIAFVFANDLLRGKKIDPSKSPWGDGQSVIFDINYLRLLMKIKNADLSEEINAYCQLFISVLDVFKSYFINKKDW